MTVSRKARVEGLTPPRKNRTKLSSVANAIRVIKAFSDQNTTLSIGALAAHLKLAKSTVHRLATTLVDEGLLEQNAEDGKYQLGLGLFELGALVRRKMSITEEARPFLKSLAHATGETLYLAVLDQQSILYINIIESRRAIRMGYRIGARAPLHCTAAGKLLLAFQPAAVIENAISPGLSSLTAATIAKPQALRVELSSIRAKGYAMENEESEVGLRGIAAPVRGHSGDVIASIGIAGPTHRLTRKLLLKYSHDLVAAAGAISQRLGYPSIRVVQLHSRGATSVTA